MTDFIIELALSVAMVFGFIGLLELVAWIVRRIKNARR